MDNGEEDVEEAERSFVQAHDVAEGLREAARTAQRSTDDRRQSAAQQPTQRSESANTANGATDPDWDDWGWGGGNDSGMGQNQQRSAQGAGSRCLYACLLAWKKSDRCRASLVHHWKRFIC